MSKKICLLVSSLSSGGAEKVAANMSISLSKRGYDVTVFSMQNNITYSYKGFLFNFGLVKEKYGKFKALFRLISFFNDNKFDVIIDHRLRDKYIKELVFSKFIFRKFNIIYCIHNYHLQYYFSFLKSPWLAKLPHVKKHSFIAVCNEIRYHLKEKLNINSKTIYNFIDDSQLPLKTNNGIEVPENFIIGVGRLTEVKQFDVLIESYKQSKLPQHKIKLLILGDGPERNYLQDLIDNSSCRRLIELKGFVEHPYILIQKAKALVLSSKFEGFPMVLLEALNLSTPLIAYNCNSGPSEIIKHNINGVLVENQNKIELTAALNTLLDDVFYEKIKANSTIGLEVFSEETIIQEWENIFRNHK